MTTLIDLDEMIDMQAAIKRTGNDAHAEILLLLHQINCLNLDVDENLHMAEELVDAAGIARDLADADVMNRQQDADDTRADDELNTRKADGI